jgi:hypothetical protein
LPFRLGEAFRVDVDDDQRGALLRQAQGNGAADARCRAGYEGNLAGYSTAWTFSHLRLRLIARQRQDGRLSLPVAWLQSI